MSNQMMKINSIVYKCIYPIFINVWAITLNSFLLWLVQQILQCNNNMGNCLPHILMILIQYLSYLLISVIGVNDLNSNSITETVDKSGNQLRD